MRWSARDYNIKLSFSQQRSRCAGSASHPPAPEIGKIHRDAKNPAHSGDRPQQRHRARPNWILRREVAILACLPEAISDSLVDIVQSASTTTDVSVYIRNGPL